MTQRTTCTGCGSDKLQQFLDLDMSPIADAYTTTAFEEVQMYPLQLAVCEDCWLVQLLEVVSSRELFGTGYSFYSSASPPLSAYHRKYADNVIALHGELARGLVVEIGCNDGDMLQWFAKAGSRVLGVDPAEGPISVARDHGLNVLDTEFTARLAEDILAAHGSANIIIANHVLAHVENVFDVLAGIKLLLADDGVAYIEVQYLPDLLVNNAFDLVYHEHRNFFSLTSIMHAVQAHGLYVCDVQLTRRQGGSMRIMLRKTNERVLKSVPQRYTSEKWLRRTTAYGGLQGRVERIRERVWDTLWELFTRSHMVYAGYGAPAKATTLLSYCRIDSSILQFVVDSTQAKQGRFIPDTGVPIVAPGTRPAPDVYLLLAWNYAHEIITETRTSEGYSTKWIVPIPTPLVL